MVFKLFKRESTGPMELTQIHEHLLLQFVLAIVNFDGIIVTIETMNEIG
jgi:hypothetical protein